MAEINGTLLLVYINGVVVAAQKGVTFTLDVDTPDTSTKDSGGWSTHMNGQRSFNVDINKLVSTSGLTAAGLIALITARTDILLVIKGGISYPYVMKSNMANISLSGDHEQPLAVNGSIKGSGPCYYMDSNLITTLGDSDTYDTFTTDGIAVTSAIDAGGGAIADSDNIDITDTYYYMVFTFLTLNSGEAPNIGIYSGAAYISNEETLTAGANFITLIAEATDATCTARLENTGASNYALTDTYIWEVIP